MPQKVFILFFLLSNALMSSYAQNQFVQPGAEWHYDFILAGGWYYEHMVYDRDSTIGGKNCQVLVVDYYDINYFTNALQKGHTHEEYLYNSGDTVFWYQNGQFTTLFNFAANVNDSWDLGIDTNVGRTSIVTVTKIDTIVIDGQSLKEFTLSSSLNASHTIYQMTERIGSLSYLFPEYIEDSTMIDHVLKDLHCYFDDSFTSDDFGPNNWPHSCDAHLYLGINVIENQKIAIYPNPASDVLHVSEINGGYYEIYNIDGKVVLSGYAGTDIDISNCKNGIYILKIKTEKEGLINHRFVKMK